ncbi:DUF4332 domain-containing protein [Planctomycetaceae bacterium SH139]
MLTWIRGFFSAENTTEKFVPSQPIAPPSISQPVFASVKSATQSATPTLAAVRLGTPAQRRQLRRLGIVTLDDLQTCRPRQLVATGKLPPAAGKTLARWQAAGKLQRAIPQLSWLDAQLLVAVHRRRLADLQRADGEQLLADMQRFAISSAGQSLVAGAVARQLPTAVEVADWIATARHSITDAPLTTGGQQPGNGQMYVIGRPSE